VVGYQGQAGGQDQQTAGEEGHKVVAARVHQEAGQGRTCHAAQARREQPQAEHKVHPLNTHEVQQDAGCRCLKI